MEPQYGRALESRVGEGISPSVVPAECIAYLTPLCLRRRWTAAISAETEAVGVPIGIRQKSAVAFGGVGSVVGSEGVLLVVAMF
jgi:hypothetical protein